MASTYARCLIIDTEGMADRSLSLISKSLSETLRLSACNASDKQTLSHLMMYLIDGRVITISPLRDIKSPAFAQDSLPKIANLTDFRFHRPNRHNGVANGSPRDINNLISVIADVRQEARKLQDIKSFELTVISERDLDSITEELIHCFVGQRIDYSFLTQVKNLEDYLKDLFNILMANVLKF